MPEVLPCESSVDRRHSCLGCGRLRRDVVDEELDIGVAEDELAHAVVPDKELVIVDPSVIESPQETTFDPDHASGTSKHGAWSFGRLIHNMLPCGDRDDPVAASTFVRGWLAHWATDQSPNPQASPADARPALEMALLSPWRTQRRAAETMPALEWPGPFRLVAIGNRRPAALQLRERHRREGRPLLPARRPTRRTVVDALEILDATPSPEADRHFRVLAALDDNAEP